MIIFFPNGIKNSFSYFERKGLLEQIQISVEIHEIIIDFPIM